MKRMVWATIWALALVLPGCADSHQRSKMAAQSRWDMARNKVYFRLAKDAYDNGNLSQCRKQLGKIFNSEEPYGPAYLLAAKVAMREQRFTEAHDYIEMLLRMAPDSADVWYAKALLSERDGDIDSALEAMTKAQALDPSDPEYQLCLAEMQVRCGEPDRALATLLSVEGRFNTHAGIQSGLADLHMMMGDYASAALCLRRLIRSDPQDAEARERLGLCLARSGQAEDAVPLLESVVRGRDVPPIALLSALAECYATTGRYVEAEGTYAILCKHQPNNPDWNFRLGECYTAQNDDRAAMERLDRALTLDPHHADARALAGYLCYVHGDLAAAEAHLRLAIDRIDEPGLVAVVLTKTLRRLGRDKEANEVWAEFGGNVEVVRKMGVTEEMAAVPSSRFSLTGQVPAGSVKR